MGRRRTEQQAQRNGLNVSLTQDIKKWLAAKVDSGQYKTISEVVRAAIREKRMREEIEL